MRSSLKGRVCTPARIDETDVSAGLVELDVSTFSRISIRGKARVVLAK
jgi:hypothetical protein